MAIRVNPDGAFVISAIIVMLAIVAVLSIGPILTEIPTIGMNLDFHFAAIAVGLVGVPAVVF
jgi:hypothetical protein